MNNRVEENLDLTRTQTPKALNQELKVYYTLNEDHIFSFEAQHLDQTEDPIGRAVRDRNPFLSLIPFDSNVQRFDITQNRFIETQKLEAKLDYFYLLNDQSNINLSIGFTNVAQNYLSDFNQTLDDGTAKSFDDEQFNNNVDFSFKDLYFALNYRIRTGIFTIDPGLTLHFYDNKNTQLGQTFAKDISDIRPNLRVNMQFKKNENLRFTYRKNTVSKP